MLLCQRKSQGRKGDTLPWALGELLWDYTCSKLVEACSEVAAEAAGARAGMGKICFGAQEALVTDTPVFAFAIVLRILNYTLQFTWWFVH